VPALRLRPPPLVDVRAAAAARVVMMLRDTLRRLPLLLYTTAWAALAL